ncbi:MAG: hypothetical protein C4341_04005 [Armatimonadota bacterium]
MPPPVKRVFGIETEFGCLVESPDIPSYEIVVERVKDHIFHGQRLGLIDRHSRDEAFEPAYSGGFLINGGRLYVDVVGSHEEYATPECANIFDLIAADRAGQRILVRALRELELDGVASFYNNAVDHFGGHTFGCHENYLVRADERFLQESVHRLYPFLVTRQIYAGVGRVGGHLLDFAGSGVDVREVARHPIDFVWVSNVYGVRPDPNVRFQLSQRSDHIIKTIASRVRFNRALINPKWETLFTHGDTSRLHMLFGESNQMEYAFALKVGTTALVLDLIEEDLVPDWMILEDPLHALRSVSRDTTWRWQVTLADGTTIRATDLHREYLQRAIRYKGRDDQTDWVLQNWEESLDLLDKDPMLLGDRLDWVAKYSIVEQYREQAGADWSDDSLHSVDLEYHNIDPKKSLFHALDQMGNARHVVDEMRIVEAMTEPPQTRAAARARIIRDLLKSNAHSYWVDWHTIQLDRDVIIEMPDPLDTYDYL